MNTAEIERCDGLTPMDEAARAFSIWLAVVMPGLVPGIHEKEDVDGRDEPGHDDV